MTTINNSENLIEKVGGIEKAREIVSGAPDKTADTYVADTDTYFSAEFGSYFNHAEFDWLDSDYKFYAEIRDNYETVFWLKDLRTAIAEHDLKQCQHGYDIACLICGFGNENGVRVWRNQIESDEVTDIRNHLSPSTRVVDL
ncbi:hypothetical protein ACG9XR_23245 [Acinetobacter guillouiae]|uniref:hypothetical protein n=1 Tax=Acinetobacter guillouiae TaxID=106649 RepID=UPI003AF87E4F